MLDIYNIMLYYSNNFVKVNLKSSVFLLFIMLKYT